MPKLYLIRGLPGSGKTWHAKRLKVEVDTPYHFEADMWFAANPSAEYNFRTVREAHRWCLEATCDAMEEGKHHVIVSNCFVTRGDVEPYASNARWFKYEINYHVMVGRWPSHRSVPEWKIHKMAMEWDYSLPMGLK